MLQSYGNPELGKPHDDPTHKQINYKALLHHLYQFGCYGHSLISEKQTTDQKLKESAKPCMMVSYVHDSTTLWRIFDP